MGFISGLFKTTLGGGGRRIGTGAIIGGIYGGASSEANTGTGTFRDIIRGATWGGLGGSLTTKTGLKGIKYGSIGIGAASGFIGWKAAKGIGSMAIRKPVFTAGLALGGYGAYTIGRRLGPESKSADLGSLKQYAEQVGTSTGVTAHQQFRNSTYGLVQGLHSRRSG